MGLEIQILAWDRYKNVAGLKQFIRSQSSPLYNWISNGNTDINKQLKKTCTDWLPLKKTTYYYKDDTNSTIAGSVNVHSLLTTSEEGRIFWLLLGQNNHN